MTNTDTPSPTLPGSTLDLPYPAAELVLQQFGRVSIEPGSFARNLAATLAAADLGHRARLALAFPVLVGFWHLAASEPGGLDKLERAFSAASSDPTSRELHLLAMACQFRA